MFEADAEKYLSVQDEMNATRGEASLAQTAGMGSDAAAAGAVGGAWTACLFLSRVNLGDALDGFVDLCDAYAKLAGEAGEYVRDNLVPARDSVLTSLGAASGTAGKVIFDEAAALHSRFLEVDVSIGDFKSAVGLASLSTLGLPGAEQVTGPLSELSASLDTQGETFTSTVDAFGKYRAMVGDFEASYSQQFSTLIQNALDERAAKDMSAGIQAVSSLIAMSGDDGVTGLQYVAANGGG